MDSANSSYFIKCEFYVDGKFISLHARSKEELENIIEILNNIKEKTEKDNKIESSLNYLI